MKKSKKNIDNQSENIIRYLEDKMTPAERNAFEKKLQSDPFLAEALEGYSITDTDSIDSDLAHLKKRLHSVTKKRSTLLYRVAAAVIILVGISSVLLVRNLRQPDMKMAEGRNILEDMTPEEPLSDLSETKKGLSREFDTGKQERKEIPEEKSLAELQDRKQDSIPELREAIPEVIIEHEIIPEAETVAIAKTLPEKAEEFRTADRIAGVEADKGVLSKSARRDEVVATMVAGKVTERKAQPLTGEEEYNKYLAENQVYPEGYQMSDSVEVKLELIIQEDGSIGKIEIKGSPDKEFSDEAMRLIKNGPIWLPAIKDGEAVKDTVNLKILFKRND
jgi:outer membrane biosynthesis protein TonB